MTQQQMIRLVALGYQARVLLGLTAKLQVRQGLLNLCQD
jgi:hypothetical protein